MRIPTSSELLGLSERTTHGSKGTWLHPIEATTRRQYIPNSEPCNLLFGSKKNLAKGDPVGCGFLNIFLIKVNLSLTWLILDRYPSNNSIFSCLCMCVYIYIHIYIVLHLYKQTENPLTFSTLAYQVVSS